VTTPERLQESLRYNRRTGVLTRRIQTSNRVHTGDVAGYKRPDGYISVCIGGQSHLAHRLIWLMFYGVWPEGDVDHINGVRDDNRLCNLRLATRSENLQNVSGPRSSNRSSGILGVTWDKNRQQWKTNLTINGINVHQSRHDRKEDAAFARRDAEKRFHPFRRV
jgi:hypothetical protein